MLTVACALLYADEHRNMAGPGQKTAEFATIPFRNRAGADANLAQIRERVPAQLVAVIPPLLADLPDPDAALNYFERLTENANRELIRLLAGNHSLVHYALVVFGFSNYLSETLLQNADILQTLLRDTNLDRSHEHEEFREAFARFRSRSFETDIALLLARFKRREYVRIMLRDVLGFATLAETTAEISALSDVLIDEALRACTTELHRKYGQPQHRDAEGRLVETPFTVLGLGKLGGNELNYSSDIDLFYVYGDGEADEAAPITNREYFVRLGQQVTNVLSRVTAEGFVFRIDLRLRPQGREGETAISLESASHYYSRTAQDWERQAMIKARPVAGDVKLARQFIRGLQEHVYTEKVNFPAIETALEALDRMRNKRVAAPSGSLDVKLDRGGIRDIEFLVQCLQRVYGGKQRWLRSGGTLFSLQKLHDKRHISGSDFHHLTTAYEFLRCIEHRLQLRNGQQTHRVPTDENDLQLLARSLSRAGEDALSPPALLELVRSRMEAVSVIYDRIIHQQHRSRDERVPQQSGVETAEVEFGRVPSDQQVLRQLGADSPELYRIAANAELEPHTRRNLFKFLSSAFTSAERYRAVAAAPEAVERALQLFRTSEFLTDILVRHPEDVASLNDLRSSSARHQDEVVFSTDDLIRGRHSAGLEDYLASDALTWSEGMALLRRRFRYRTFLSGARDVIETRPVFASLVDLTSGAKEAIAAAWAMAGRPKGMAILGLGRLGTGEFDCLSDADLLFVRDKRVSAKRAMTVAEQVVHALTAYTNEGTVMTVDMRLRPHGREGEMTITLEKLASYFENEASAWEALTHTKLRWIAGDETLARKAESAALKLRERYAGDPGFADEVRQMRAKLEKSEPSLKTLPGGSYDVDFLVGYLIIKHGVEIAEGTISDRLKKLGNAGFLSSRQVQDLLDAMELFRTLDHAVRLVTGRTAKTVPVSETSYRLVTELVSKMLSRPPEGTLDDELKGTWKRVRAIYDSSVH